MTYHLTYVTTDNELHTFVCDSELTLTKGWHRIRTCVERYAIPVYMLIKDEQGRTYYIPEYELLERFKLTKQDKIVFLHECFEKGLISLQLYNMINYCEHYKGALSQTEKDILNNLSIVYCFSGRTEEGYEEYKVEL